MYQYSKLIITALLAGTALPAAAAGSKYDRFFHQAAARHHVPFELLRAVCSVESSLNQNAYVHRDGGPNDSIGLCQVQVAAARDVGVKLHRSCDFGGVNCELWSPSFNIDTAARYLAYQYQRYERSSWNKAVLAYNAGSFRLNKKGEPVNKHYLWRVQERVAYFSEEKQDD